MVTGQFAAGGGGSLTLELLRLLPQFLTGLRLVSALLLWWLVTSLEFQSALICLGFAILSDAVDGSLVRRFGVPSRAGAYFDATADFAVVAAAFSAFAHLEIYPTWLVALIALAFLVFILSSIVTPMIYDPIGRHIGGILFVATAATLLLHDFLVQSVILSVATGSLGMTLGARTAYVLAAYRHL
ncbi:CDP-alcohol phosphatidyltransferase family protein [Bradyrhizobium sp. BRP22]|uniref:CDP-alcohol phosphatidyltransferase family protein n=1 Tax=Bradyrhizobium sp. BRP22 TaxID=2793821 RepID=UPI001CD6D32A|nr:CDP-alcohol phosphatidyltransferase family protein [Bradyrhizobium sp. BRP22]MCA1452391.1 CDP-alcohol phosphatidyltransferase family protein [Bradyrhizobium sp. BRP22]